MIERLARIGRAVVDKFDIDKRRAEKQKPKSLSLDERHRLEKECGQILEKDIFGRKDFGNFCKNMMSLVRQEGDPKGFARLRDQKAKFDIDFNENGISMRSIPVATDDPHVFVRASYERISYNDDFQYFQSRLTTTAQVAVPSSIKFFSYFKGKSEPAFPKRTYPVLREEKVSDKEVQDFCKRVYGIYATDHRYIRT